MKFIKIKSSDMPTKPKPTQVLPDNLMYVWDPKANDWIILEKNTTKATPPLYDPQNQNAVNNTSATTQMYTTTKTASYDDSTIDMINKLTNVIDRKNNVELLQDKTTKTNSIFDHNKKDYVEISDEAYWDLEIAKKEFENYLNKKSKTINSDNRALSVLPRLLDKVWYDYDEGDAGRYAQIGSWEIGLGGYDTGYEVSYQGTPIFSITEDNKFKPYFSNDRLQEEFGFSYSDIERALKKHRDLVDIKLIDASKKVKSTLIDSLNQFLDGDKYSREIKIEKGLISGGLIKLAGINPIRGPKYSITEKGLEFLKKSAQEEYNFEKDYIKARKSYLLDGITEAEFKSGAPESQGQMPKFSIFEKDGSELAQIEANNETDAKVKFIMENPEYEGSQTISVKKIDSKYSETTIQGLDFPNQSVSPSTDVKVDPKGWVNTASIEKKAADNPIEFSENPKSIDFEINENYLFQIINQHPRLQGNKLDPAKNGYDYTLKYTLSSEVKWDLWLDMRSWGINEMRPGVMDQIIDIDVEYTPEDENAPIKNGMYFTVEIPIKNITKELISNDSSYNQFFLKELEIYEDGSGKAIFQK